MAPGPPARRRPCYFELCPDAHRAAPPRPPGARPAGASRSVRAPRRLPISDPLIDYYSRRAPDYERIYALPERQGDLRTLTALLLHLLAGCDVLELACGTGYWTERLAPAATAWLATDLAAPTLDLARAKTYPPGRVTFALADAFALDGLPPRLHSGAVAGFLWSHVPRPRQASLLAGLERRLNPGARVVVFDNRYVAGSNTPLSRQDHQGNTYQLRTLADGSRHEVLKNFPAPGELWAAPPAGATEVAVFELRYYWCLTYLSGGGGVSV